MTTQQTFMGASISNYTANMGWGANPSTLTVHLVEDDVNGDVFVPQDPSTPLRFEHDNFAFNGILSNWHKQFSSSGKPIYDVTLIDPRDVLSGVQLILKDFAGQTGNVPNVLNVFGYFENAAGFGYSNSNEYGIPANTVKQGIEALTSNTTNYGGQILLGNYEYQVDLTNLPSVPDNFRVPADGMTLMDFVNIVCDNTSHDFFYSLYFSEFGHRIIKLFVINRNFPPIFGGIESFASQIQGQVSSKAGYELKTETTSRMIIGGKKNTMYYRYKNESGNPNSGPDGNIWPYWGMFDGTLIVGDGYDDQHTFTLDITINGKRGYTTNVHEIRSAAESRSAWENFLRLNNDNRYVFDASGNKTATIKKNGQGDNKTYKHSEVRNIHKGKANALGIAAGVNDAWDFLGDDKKTVNKLQAKQIFDRHANEEQEKQLNNLHGFLRRVGEEYYGKQFLVLMPETSHYTDPETGKKKVSISPVNNGYLSDEEISNAQSNGLLPQNYILFTTDDGRLSPYVKFHNASKTDFKNIPPDDLIVENNVAYVKCSVVEDYVVYGDSNNTIPYAIVQLPGKVFTKDAEDNYLENKNIGFTLLKQNNTEEELKKIFNQPGGDLFNSMNLDPIPFIPLFAALPLRSNIDNYGPWYSTGANGKLELENDDSLVPWNYGGYTAMNQAANARVVNAIDNYIIAEAGSITFPGTPSLGLGGQLLNGGPYITSISVNISNSEISTTYQMNTWSPHPYKMNKQFAEMGLRFQRRNLLDQSNNQQKYKSRRDSSFNFGSTTYSASAGKSKDKSKSDKENTSNTVFHGEVVETEDGQYKTVVSVQPASDLSSQANYSFSNKGAASFESLLVPYTTNQNPPASSLLPHMEAPSYPSGGFESGHQFTRHELEPFPSDIVLASLNDENGMTHEITESGFLYDQTAIQSIALKAPLVLAGWGKDEEGNIVPSGIENYKTSVPDWKVGPLNVKWNQTARQWDAGGGSTTKLVKIADDDDFPYPSGDLISEDFQKVYKAWECGVTFSNSVGANATITVSDEDYIFVANFRNSVVLPGQYYIANDINGKYVLNNQATFIDYNE